MGSNLFRYQRFFNVLFPAPERLWKPLFRSFPLFWLVEFSPLIGPFLDRLGRLGRLDRLSRLGRSDRLSRPDRLDRCSERHLVVVSQLCVNSFFYVLLCYEKIFPSERFDLFYRYCLILPDFHNNRIHARHVDITINSVILWLKCRIKSTDSRLSSRVELVYW